MFRLGVALWFLLIFSESESSLLCDETGLSCPDDDLVAARCTPSNIWINDIENTEMKSVTDETICYLFCALINCNCALYFESDVCILLGHSSNTSYFVPFTGKTNVALEKPVTSTFQQINEDHNHPFKSSYAVDGVLDTTKYHYLSNKNLSFTDPWFAVDLEQKYDIKGIRIMTRISNWSNELLYDVDVYCGNSLVIDGDFSNYQLVGSVQTQANKERLWNYTILDGRSGKQFRYVGVKKRVGAFKHLIINEIEVLV